MGKDKHTFKLLSLKNKKGDFYYEAIFNLASYTLSHNYTIGKKNTKRATAQFMAITNYLESYKAR